MVNYIKNNFAKRLKLSLIKMKVILKVFINI